ncbi:MAG: cellulase family glycosylhydrolase [Tannerella sp.]|jgi:hypothetical protein|nr:cellulase family glycosylhydrolase [Tannerella sp.]
MKAQKKLLVTLAIWSCLTVFASVAGNPAEIGNKRITIVNKEFTVNGKRIWINGTNTPWNKWNDFGGAYDDSWWDNHFKALHDNGVNAVRVWINCNNDNGAILIDDNGFVSGTAEKHWKDLDLFFATAQRNGIYIMATLLSFDHFKNAKNQRPDAQKWRNMIADSKTIDSFVENYVVPFVNRYKNNPYLWSIDMCNEPDWVFENEECGKLPWEQISNLFAREAAAIHENSDILVTVGMSFPKYHSDDEGNSGNKVSDAFLQKLYPNPKAHLDFWSPHYYDWVGPHYGVPFYVNPYGAKPGGWGLDDSKPALIGECMAKGSKGKTAGTENNTLITDYENAYLNGWQGVMPWTSNAVDRCGGFDDLVPATKYMLEKYPALIFP